MFDLHVAVAAKDSESIISLILDADIIVQGVLLTLVGMSVACWVIILKKFNRVRMAELQTSAFVEDFWSARQIDEIYDRIQAYGHSPVAQVFQAGYQELSRLSSDKSGSSDLSSMTGEDNIARALRRASTEERTLLERNTTFLATTGSTAPFIGLFGTVWGILRAFQKIGAQGQATIDTVGADIAHALIATAVGLAAAIPAVMAYNYFNRRIRVLATEMNNFSDDFLNIVKRHFRSQ
jgi:biopolymer transport protein TolQ